jgi:hypothetical protein
MDNTTDTVTNSTNIIVTICLDTSAGKSDYPWYLKEDGEQVGQVLDVQHASATDDQLRAALRAEFPTSYGTLPDGQVRIWRSGADD